MSDLKHDFCKMQLSSLATYLDLALKKDIFENDYWPYISKFNTKHFSDAVEWLKENYEYKRFPLLSDFKKAFKATNPPENTYRPLEDKIDKMAYQKDIKALVEKFKMPDDKKEKLPKQTDLFVRMKIENKVYSYKLQKWVDRTLMKNIGGNFLLPEKKL